MTRVTAQAARRQPAAEPMRPNPVSPSLAASLPRCLSSVVWLRRHAPMTEHCFFSLNHTHSRAQQSTPVSLTVQSTLSLTFSPSPC